MNFNNAARLTTNLTIIKLICVFINDQCWVSRVCNCTITTSGFTTTKASVILLGIDTTIVSPLYTVNTNKTTFYKVSNKTAESNCANRNETINENNPTSIPGFLVISSNNVGERSHECELE